MASQQRINAYMERHKLGPLFEDLMNKVLRDMPEEPMIYLLRTMYKKAGMEIPQGIRYGGVRKSTSELPRNPSPERASRATVSHSADVGASRDYERPWATSPSRRMKPKKTDAAGLTKSRAEWNPDNKTKSTNFDELWEESDGKKERPGTGTAAVRKSPSKKTTGVVNAWATVGMGGEDETFTSPPYEGRRRLQGHSKLNEEDLLAAETLSPSLRSEPQGPGSALSATASRYSKGPKEEAKRQRARMSEMLTQSDQRSDDSGVDMPSYGYAQDEDAIELLEDADDLRREGVTNIPKTGYKLSKAMRYRRNEPRVKLNINAFAAQRDFDESASALNSVRSSPDQRELEDDDEFESVSQVTGPRQPVWKMPETEVDPLSPYYSAKAPQPSAHKGRRYTEKRVAATTPDSYFDRSVDSTEDLEAAAKSWTGNAANNRVSFENDNGPPQSTRSVSTTGGWRLPDDSDVASIHDWNKRVKGGPSMDPKAY